MRILRLATLLWLGSIAPLAAQTPDAATTDAATPGKPRWEAGVAAGAFTVADYPASDEYRTLAAPLPYFVYYGTVLRSDERGSRLRRALTPNVELNISGGGALSSDSSGSEARKGMPDLGYLLELGPNLALSFDGPQPRSKIYVNLPVRGVLSIGDPDLSWRGVLFGPEIAWRQSLIVDDALSLRIAFGADFASTRLHEYFYSVAPAFQIDGERPAYDARSGYLGSNVNLRLGYALSRSIRGFVSVSFYSYAGAANEDSPLFRSDDGYSAAVGLSWSFLRSRQAAIVE
ncbi:MAG TPA: MipA/OmpV family protein [Fontimonas sp.]